MEKHPDIDGLVAIGPSKMMEACAATTRPHNIKTTVSLNPIMVDGTGMCDGRRARPLARNGNLMGEDFLCACEPGGNVVIKPLHESAGTLNCTAEAGGRLKHVPPFLRGRMLERFRNDG